MPENGTGNPFWLKRANPPERGTEYGYIFESNPSLLELQLGCISREVVINNLRKHVLYERLTEFKECIDSASRILNQLKIGLGLDYVRLTGAPSDKFKPRQISIYHGANLTNVLDGYIWEANNIIRQYEEHSEKTKIILEIIDRLIFQ